MRNYDHSFKIEAVKLAEKLGSTKASKELNMPLATLDTWLNKPRSGKLKGGHATPEVALSLAEEVKRLRQEVKELRRTNEILADATSFFANRQKK